MTSTKPTELADAAFGPTPDLWPLPDAETDTDLWLRAVAAGAQGRYSSARADLSELLRRRPGPGLASLALSTRASFTRQQGWHAVARADDGAALALLDDPTAHREAAVDALTGLAADALGTGRLAAAAALLARATDCHAREQRPASRLAIRLAWVEAELAMAAGDPAAACAHAHRGADLAATGVLRRHRVKSDVVLAAALCSAGDLAASRRVADAALADTEALGLVPLRWALACLLAEVGSGAHSPAAVAEIRDRSATFIARHGGRLRFG